MATVWDEDVRATLVARVGRLTADTKPAWGRFHASGMVAHLNDSLRMALGDLRVKPKTRLLRPKLIRRAFIYWLPMPKGAPTAPELIARCAGASLDAERAAFAQLLDRCGALPPGSPMGEHPAFGDLSYDEYGALIAKHSDHHLRQFGL
jgi:hypothetical protein